MNLQDLIQKYQAEENLSCILWEEFPEELKKAGWKFIKEWFENVEIADLRRLSGLDEMHIEDLLAYARGELDEGAKPLGWPYR